MKTAALLPTPGDPAVARYWLRNYVRVWQGEVDELIVLVNGNPDTGDLYRDAGASVIRMAGRIGHGQALDILRDVCQADVVVLCEDDAFVREPGAIRAHLERAAEGEVLGAPRKGMSPELERAALAKWGPIVGPDTSEGHGLWPCFLFARREYLTGSFANAVFVRGQTVPGLEYEVQEPTADTDTNSAMAFRLRAAHPIGLVGNWKELWQKHLPEKAPWFHAGGFSNIDAMPREGCGGTNEGLDWAHRCWWWRRVGAAGWEEKVRVGNLEEQMAGWDDLIPPWITWDER